MTGSPAAPPTDKDLGRFYTPPHVAQLTLALAVAPPGGPRWKTARIWDPTCGDGGFLRQAVALGAGPEQLTGHDLDGAALARLRSALPHATLAHADLFDLDPARVGLFDAIAGNPPYVRHERLAPARRRTIAAGVGAFLGMDVSPGLDLSLLALAHCLRFLAPGGRLAFVLPATWLDVARGAGVRHALLDRFALRAVIESRSEPWFADAAVNTVIAVFGHHHGDETVFAAIDRAGPQLAEAIAAGRAADGLRCRRVPRGRLHGAPSWSPFLRAPSLWFAVQDDHADAFVPPAEVLALSYGTKPGISAFFAPRDPAELQGVEPRCLRPFLRTLKGVDRYVLDGATVTGRLLAMPPGDPPPGAQRWIDAGAAVATSAGVPWPQVPSVRGNTPWWRMKPPMSGPVLFPQFRAARHHVIDNPDGVLVNNSAWWGRWHDPALHGVGVALLNTSWMALAAEVLGRVNLGEGLLTLYGPEIARLPVPDPRRVDHAGPLLDAWARMCRRPVLPFLEEVEQPDRHALDAAALQALGLDPALGPAIRDAIVPLLSDRLTLAARRRRPRTSKESQ